MDSSKPGPKPTSNVFGFIDEIGLLNTPKSDQLFGLGLIKLQHPSLLHKKIVAYKTKHNYHTEFKFANISPHNLIHYKNLLDLYFSLSNTHFSCLMIDKSTLDITTHFKNDYQKAYNSFLAKMVANALDTSEYIVILADDICTPKTDKFESEIKTKIKKRTRRNALFGICRLDSKSVSEIQVVDVLLGTIAYAFKIKHGLVKANRTNPKFKLLKHLQSLINVDYLAKSKELNMRYARTIIIDEYKGVITKNADSAVGNSANKGRPTPSVRERSISNMA